MKTLILLRGLPGAGKSTFAKMLVGEKDYLHKEADMFFVDREGNYNFEPEKLKAAHLWCREEVEFLMKHDHPLIVVSNTFTQEWEMSDYFAYAEKHGYRIVSLIVENRHFGNSIHEVPMEKIRQMEDRFDVTLY
jgi:predicted kinase